MRLIDSAGKPSYIRGQLNRMKTPPENMTEEDTTQDRSAPRTFPFWKGIALTVAAVGIFFGLLEAVLALFGLQPVLRSEDPFVGFATNIPLFVQKADTDERPVMVTAENKHLFNRQQFPLEKPSGTYRIFCLGGSTTYGRPYDDTTSFCGWLRELLPVADPRRQWEVINAGGISYASYRVAHLMEELARYQPDLFIVYSGHNEFLEERSYGALRDIPGPIKSTAAVLARTRTWAAMKSLLNRAGALPAANPAGRVQLSGEVDTLLRRFGPDIYRRNDPLREQVLVHYRISLQRMVDIAGSAGAELIFVTPAANLKDSSPFKSENTEGLSEKTRSRVRTLLNDAMERLRDGRASEALAILDEAIDIDPRFAELHYRRGKALFELGRYPEAMTAFGRARDEDICPLRALSPMRATLAAVAQDSGAALLDFIDHLEQRLQGQKGHRILGEEYFLDHVHPTIEGNRILALQLVETMAARGIVLPTESWNDESIAAVATMVEGRIDVELQSKALSNLAKVLAWSGKVEDASRLAHQAIDSGGNDPAVILESANILAVYYAKLGDVEQEKKYFRMALNADPGNPDVHFQIGLQILKNRRREFEIAASHILFASVFWSENHRDLPHQLLGRIMAQRNRFAAAYANLLESRRMNPQNAETEALLALVRKRLGQEATPIEPPKVSLKRHPSGFPSSIVQVRRNAAGKYIPEGIWTEWYESGELKRYVDYADGVPHGMALSWNREGQILSQSLFRNGVRSEVWGKKPAAGK